MHRRLASSKIVLAAIIVGSWLWAFPANAASVSTGGLVGLYRWPEDSVNLVRNSSFERLDGARRVVGWRVGKGFSPTTGVARSGLRSMNLKDSHLVRYYPNTVQALPLKPGWYNMRGWIKAVNAGTNRRGAGGRISVKWGKGWVSSRVIRGTTDWIKVGRSRFPIMPGESASVRLEAYRKPDGSVLFDDIEVHRQIPPVVEGFLLYPNYRGMLFDDRPQTIRMSVKVRPEEAKARLADLYIRLILETDNGQRKTNNNGRWTAVFSPTTPSFVLSLDASEAPLGVYLLRLQAFHKRNGVLLFEYPSYRIVKAPSTWRSAISTYVDSDNVLVLNGKRTFVLGIYDTSGYSNSPKAYKKRISKIAEAPLDLYLNYWLGRAPASALTALMTMLRRHGMYYLHTVNTWYKGHRQWPGGRKCNGQPARNLGAEVYTACMAETLGVNPGLAGWYSADERPASQVERVFGQYKILRARDPGGVTFIAQNKMRELPRWRDAVDVVGVDPYPIFNIPKGNRSPLQKVTKWVAAAQHAVERSRPVWAVIQFFKFGSKGHWPTYEELRTMSYMAIVAGAKGLFYWSYGAKGLSWVKDPQKREEYWQRLVKVTREIKSLEPALISPDAPEVLSSLRLAPSAEGVVQSDVIRVLTKQVDNIRYVIAVNNTAREVQAEFMLSEPARTVEVIGERRAVSLSGSNRYADGFVPYATHVYKISVPMLK